MAGTEAMSADDSPHPHRLAVYWRVAGPADAPDGCDILVPRGLLHLNATAAVIWTAIDGRRDEGELADVLCAACVGLSRATAREAVVELLETLADAGAIVRKWRPLDPWLEPRLPPRAP